MILIKKTKCMKKNYSNFNNKLMNQNKKLPKLIIIYKKMNNLQFNIKNKLKILQNINLKLKIPLMI